MVIALVTHGFHDVKELNEGFIINMLTRYARTQFLDPNKAVSMGIMWVSHGYHVGVTWVLGIAWVMHGYCIGYSWVS